MTVDVDAFYEHVKSGSHASDEVLAHAATEALRLQEKAHAYIELGAMIRTAINENRFTDADRIGKHLDEHLAEYAFTEEQSQFIHALLSIAGSHLLQLAGDAS